MSWQTNATEECTKAADCSDITFFNEIRYCCNYVIYILFIAYFCTTLIVKIIKLCPRGAQTCARLFFAAVVLTLNHDIETDRDLDILKMYHHTENKIARPSYSKMTASV